MLSPQIKNIVAALRDHQSRKRLINEAALLTSRVLSIGSSVITSGISAHALGVERRGVFFYGLVLASSISQFINLGMASTNVYHMARAPEQRNTILLGTISVSLLASALAVTGFVLLAALPGFTAWRTGIPSLLLFLLTSATLLNLTIPVCLIGIQRHVETACAQMSGTVLGVVLCVAAWKWTPTVEGFSWSVWGSLIVVPAISLPLLLNAKGPVRSPNWNFFREWLTFGLRAFPFVILSGFVLRATVFVAKPILDPVAFGYLSISYQVFDAAIAVPTTIAVVMFPRIVSKNQLEFSVFVAECKRILLISTAACLLGCLALPVLIPLVFGRAFWPSVPIVLCYLPGLLGFSVVSIAANFISAIRFPWSGLVAWGIGVVLSSILSYVGTLMLGAVGLALGTSLALILSAAIFAFVLRFELSRPTKPAPGPAALTDEII